MTCLYDIAGTDNAKMKNRVVTSPHHDEGSHNTRHNTETILVDCWILDILDPFLYVLGRVNFK